MGALLDKNLLHETTIAIPKWQIAFTARLAIIRHLCYHFKEVRIRVTIEEKI